MPASSAPPAATPPADRSAGHTVEWVVARIKADIRHGDCAPGQRLVASDLTSRFQVSLGIVREAFRILEGHGLLILHPNKGAQIRSLSAADVQEIFEAREAVEGQAARLAALRADTAEARAVLSAAMRSMSAGARLGRVADYQVENRRFHEAILGVAANGRLRGMAEQLLLPVYRVQLHQLIDPSAVAGSAREHRAIGNAILHGDADASERLMRLHIRASGELLLASMRAISR